MINHPNTKTNKITTGSKLKIALDALKRDQPITTIAKNNDCSRNTVYAQQEKALAAVNDAFNEATDGALFYVPMTQSVIKEHVLD